MEQKLSVHSGQAFGLNSVRTLRRIVVIGRSNARLLATYIHVTANESSDTFIVTAAGGLIA